MGHLLPGERGALGILHSELSSSNAKADAAAKLREIDAIRQHNAESERRWRERTLEAKRQADVRAGICPTCGRGPE
jgi:hypothetical protein